MTLNDVKILVVGDRVWGKGDTLEESLKKAGKPRYFIGYICEPKTTIDGMGNFVFYGKQRPKKFMEKLPKKKKPKKKFLPI